MSRKVNDTTGLSRLFHLNSEPWLNEQAMPNAPFVQKTKSHADAKRFALPKGDAGEVEALAITRRSARAFEDTPLALADFAALLRAGYAALSPDVATVGQKFLRRPVPSAGGLYPLELYALVRNVDGLTRGVYHYDAVADDLELLSDDAWEQAAEDAFLTWGFVDKAPVIICIGAVFERTQSKYGPRGYRYVLLEAGHVTQNLCLAAEEKDLSSLCLGGYHDSVLNRIVGLDGEAEAVVYAVALGKSAEG